MVFTLKPWQHYLYDEYCEIFTNHKNLKYFLTQNELNLRQHRWLELLKDYDLSIQYYPGKANVVANALSKRAVQSLRMMITQHVPLLAELRHLELEIVFLGTSARLMCMVLQPTLLDIIWEK